MKSTSEYETPSSEGEAVYIVRVTRSRSSSVENPHHTTMWISHQQRIIKFWSFVFLYFGCVLEYRLVFVDGFGVFRAIQKSRIHGIRGRATNRIYKLWLWLGLVLGLDLGLGYPYRRMTILQPTGRTATGCPYCIHCSEDSVSLIDWLS